MPTKFFSIHGSCFDCFSSRIRECDMVSKWSLPKTLSKLFLQQRQQLIRQWNILFDKPDKSKVFQFSNSSFLSKRKFWVASVLTRAFSGSYFITMLLLWYSDFPWLLDDLASMKREVRFARLLFLTSSDLTLSGMNCWRILRERSIDWLNVVLAELLVPKTNLHSANQRASQITTAKLDIYSRIRIVILQQIFRLHLVHDQSVESCVKRITVR